MRKLDSLSGFNPLRGLTLDRLVVYFEEGERGYYRDLQWLFRLVMRRNATARAVRRKLQGAIGRLDWNIKVRDDADGFDEALAEEQRKALRGAYEQLCDLKGAIGHLAMADLVGFSHLVKVYAGSPGLDPQAQKEGADLDPWAIIDLRPVPPWLMCRDGLFAPWQFNRDAHSTNRGEPINEHWIAREVDDPAAEIFTLAHVKMSVTDADWDQFCDTYAVPAIFVIGPPNVPKNKEAEYQQTAERIVGDGRGYLPHGSKVETVESKGAGESAFTERLRFYREEIVLAGTGGILTTLDGNTGIGKGPAEEHDSAWLDIAAEIGADVSAVLQEDFDRPLLDRLFPGKPRLAYFELEKPKKDASPTDILGDAKAATEAGFTVDAEEFSEKTGYKLSQATTPTPLQPKSETEATASPAANVPTNATPPEQPVSAPAPATVPTPPESPASPVAPPAPATPPKGAKNGEPDSGLVSTALAQNLGLEERWLAPVREPLGTIEDLLNDPNASAEDVAAKIEEIANQMPDLLGSLNVDALADALEAASGTAAVAGLREALTTKRKAKPKTPPETAP